MSMILSAIGALTLVILGLKLLFFVWNYFLAPTTPLGKLRGKWAVVTGASAGIGAGFARQFAKRGMNVALLARSVDKLQEVAAACEKYGVETRVLTFDFGTASEEDFAELASTLSSLSPSVLVNNVGVNVSFPTEFTDMPADQIDRIVRININSTNKMTAMLLPSMIKQKYGVVLCLSSAGGAVSPGPMLAPYSGTKSYIDSFAVALSGEVARHGVVVHSLTPFFVESAMAKRRRSFTVPTPDAFAAATIRRIGGPTRLSPHWPHAVMATALTSLPLKQQVKVVTDIHSDIRKRALRKQERLAKQT